MRCVRKGREQGGKGGELRRHGPAGRQTGIEKVLATAKSDVYGFICVEYWPSNRTEPAL